MAKDVIQMIETTEISRRSFVSKTLRFSAGAVGVIAGSSAMVTFLAGCGAAKGVDFSVTSIGDATSHSHAITVLGTDMDNPPTQKSIPTSNVFQHTHEVTLSKADFEAIKDGQTVSKTCTTTGTPVHSHNFSIKKP